MTPMWRGQMGRLAPRRIGVAGYKGVSPTAKIFTSGLALNLPPQYHKLREQLNMTDQPVRWLREDVTIHALFRELFQSWRLWQLWF